MKTILVPVGGADTDAVVVETAMAAARPLAAHLRFLHFRVSAAAAAQHTPHVEFARGPAIAHALARLETEAKARSLAAARDVAEACARAQIDMTNEPHPTDAVTASWQEENGNALERLIFHARHSDLTVMARARRPDGLPAERLETLLVHSGRPLMVTSQQVPRTLTGTIMVCWKEKPEAARALAASMPLLRKAERVHFVAVKEGDEDIAAALQDLVRQVRWHGVAGDTRVITADRRSTSEFLLGAAKDCGADLMVMGGYGHTRAREFIFGGCTQAILENADLPVLLVH